MVCVLSPPTPKLREDDDRPRLFQFIFLYLRERAPRCFVP